MNIKSGRRSIERVIPRGSKPMKSNSSPINLRKLGDARNTIDTPEPPGPPTDGWVNWFGKVSITNLDWTELVLYISHAREDTSIEVWSEQPPPAPYRAQYSLREPEVFERFSWRLLSQLWHVTYAESSALISHIKILVAVCPVRLFRWEMLFVEYRVSLSLCMT